MRRFGIRLNSRLIGLFAVVLALASMPGEAGELPVPGKNAIGIIAVAELPAEARDTLQLIRLGGPYSYDRDGVVFNNYERILPKQTRGYYREYTVRTPGVRHRGARRIVCGPPVECYYSPDHYRTFKRIRE